MEVRSTQVNLKAIHNYGKPPRQGKLCPEKADFNSSPLPISSGAFYAHGLTLIVKLISNYVHYKLWDDITYPFRYFNSATVEVYEMISNFIYALLNIWLLIHAGINVFLVVCTAEMCKDNQYNGCYQRCSSNNNSKFIARFMRCCKSKSVYAICYERFLFVFTCFQYPSVPMEIIISLGLLYHIITWCDACYCCVGAQ